MKNRIKALLDISQNCYERFIDLDILAEMTHLDITLAGCSNLSGNIALRAPPPLNIRCFIHSKGKLS
jgi:hypothetical protein